MLVKGATVENMNYESLVGVFCVFSVTKLFD